jgi:competence protein ComEA
MEPHLTFEGARSVATIVPRALPRTAPGVSRGADAARSMKPPARIDVNRASAERLAELPGIGPTLAARIVEARRRSAFRTLDDLTRVSGIGPSTVSRLAGRAVAGRGAR